MTHPRVFDILRLQSQNLMLQFLDLRVDGVRIEAFSNKGSPGRLYVPDLGAQVLQSFSHLLCFRHSFCFRIRLICALQSFSQFL